MKRRLFDHRLFYDRADAGQLLAEHVGIFASPDLIALGLARGGVPIAAEVAASPSLRSRRHRRPKDRCA